MLRIRDKETAVRAGDSQHLIRRVWQPWPTERGATLGEVGCACFTHTIAMSNAASDFVLGRAAPASLPRGV